MKSTFTPGLLKRVSEASSTDELKTIRSQAATVYDIEAFSLAVGLVARCFDAEILTEALRTDDGAVALAQNPNLDDATRDLCLTEIANELGMAVTGEPNGAPKTEMFWNLQYRALRYAAERGLLRADSRALSALWGFIERNAFRMMRDHQMLPTTLVSVLLSIPDLPREDLLRMTAHLKHGHNHVGWAENNIEAIIQHPASDATVWLEVMGSGAVRSNWLLFILEHTPALKDEAVLEHLHALAQAGPFSKWRKHYPRLLQYAEGERFREMWLEYREHEPEDALRILSRAAKARVSAIKPTDLAFYLSSGRSAWRESAILCLGRLPVPGQAAAKGGRRRK